METKEIEKRINEFLSSLEDLKNKLEIDDKKKRMEELNKISSSLDFWNDIESTKPVLEEQKRLGTIINKYDNIFDSVTTLNEMLELELEEGDLESLTSEIEELDSKIIEVNERINIEEKTMMITQDLLDNKENDLLDKLSDNIELLKSSNRVENLINEQQYLYVNVDVIKEEIINLWNKESSSNKKVKDPKEETKIEDKNPEKSKEEVPVDNEKTTEVEDTDEYFDFDDDNNLEVIDYLD